jgi:predicted metal-binding membrane protein
MLVLLVVGLMNVGWMVLVAALIFAEKVVPHGPLVGKLAGAGLVVMGIAAMAGSSLSPLVL